MAASYRKTPVLESLFNSEYCKIFKSTYFEEHLRTGASENVFMKLIKIKIYSQFYIKKQVFSSISETNEYVCFYFMIGFLSLFHIQYFCGVVRNKLQTLNIKKRSQEDQ